MLTVRVIPCLDVAGGRVVKGTRFVDLVDAGDPAELAGRYAAEGADEIVFLDISAAPEGRTTLRDVVERTARRAFVPLTVGGGVRTTAEMRDVLRAGADKVSLNTAAVATPDLVRRCARRFGSQAVVVAIDARRRATTPGQPGEPVAWEVVVKGGREATGLDAVAPASCSSPRSTATAPRRASTPRCCGPSRTASRFPSWRLGAPPGQRISWPPSSWATRRRSSPPPSSTTACTPSPRSRRRWPPPASRSGPSRRSLHEWSSSPLPRRSSSRPRRAPLRARRSRARGRAGYGRRPGPRPRLG